MYLWIYKLYFVFTLFWMFFCPHRFIRLLFNHHHHHHPARISLTLSRHFSLSFIVSGRSSGLHPVSSHSCCMYVRAGRPTLAHPYVGVHRSTSLMSSSLLLQQCPACLVRQTCIVFVMGGKCPYSWSLVGCCRQDLFNTALNGTKIFTKTTHSSQGHHVHIYICCVIIPWEFLYTFIYQILSNQKIITYSSIVSLFAYLSARTGYDTRWILSGV